MLATSKLKQRERFREAGVPQPPWELCRRSRRSKPPPTPRPPRRRQGAGPAGPARPRPGADGGGTEPAARRPSTRPEPRRRSSRIAPGRELTVNAFLVDGRFQPLTITDRLVADPPAFGVALAHVWPSALPRRRSRRLRRRRAGGGRAGDRAGPVYVQVLAGDDGPQVIELAARLGGGHDAELSRVALGVDLNRLALAAALGEEVARRSSARAAGRRRLRPLPRPAGRAARRGDGDRRGRHAPRNRARPHLSPSRPRVRPLPSRRRPGGRDPRRRATRATTLSPARLPRRR